MAAIDFPNSPSLNQEFTAGTLIYVWNGTTWNIKSSSQPPSSSIVSYSANAPVNPTAGQVWVESDVDVDSIDLTTVYSKTEIDNALALKSNIASPTFTGTPGAPTAPVDTNTTQIATTAFVVGQGYLKSSTASSTYASLANASLTGVPTAPTASLDTSTTQIATTEFIINQGYLKSSSASSTYAPLASPTLTGIPAAPTASAGTNTTQIATTAFVRTEVSNLVASAPSALDTLDELAAALGDDANFATTVTNSIATRAPLSSPTFTGTVVLPSTTSIGNVSSTELGHLDGVTSAIQTQLDNKANLSGATFTSNILINSTNEWNVNIRSANTINTSRNHFIAQRSNGSSAVSAGFNLGGLSISGYDGTNFGWGWNGGAEISAYATETWTSTARGTSISIWNTPNGSTGTAERIKIDQDGRVRIFQVLEAPVSTNAQTGTSYTLVLADAGRAIEMNNAAANTLTVPTDASVNFPIGTVIDIFQTGAGQTTVGGAGVTINARPGLKLSGQWATATLIKRAANTWLLTGSLSA
jgi:hypothetical protein